MNDDGRFKVLIEAELVFGKALNMAKKAAKAIKAEFTNATNIGKDITKQVSTGYQLRSMATRKPKIKAERGWSDIGAHLADWVKMRGVTESVWKNVKRIGLALFGVTTIYRGIIKSVSTYLSYDKELQARLNGTYYALGSLFAPILKWILDMLGTFVLYVDAFARGLGFAGINMSKLASSTGKASKMLAPFDEINNLSEGSSGGGASIGDPFKDLSIGKFGDMLFKFGQWCKENIPTLIGIIVGFATAFKILGLNIEKFSLKALGIGLVFGGAIALIGDFIGYLNDPTIQNLGKVIRDIGVILVGVGTIIGTTTGLWIAMAGAVVAVVGIIMEHWDTFKVFFKKIVDGIKGFWTTLTGNLKKAWTDAIDSIKSGWESGWKKIGQAISDWWKQRVQNILDAWEWIKQTWNDITGWISEKWNNFINPIVQKANGLLGILNSIFNKNWKINVSEVVTKVNGGLRGLASYDVGTSYVPNDQLAYIHQGEAVIPKKFNSSEYFKNDETNALLQTLIDRVDAIELNPYVTVTDVGKASVKYINQQARIKGGSVI